MSVPPAGRANRTGGDKPSRPPSAWGSSKPRLGPGRVRLGRICSGLGYVESIFMEVPSQSWRTWHPEGPG